MGSNTEARRIRVLIVDDHAMFAESLMLALGADERIEPIGYAEDGLEGVALAEYVAPDVVLMDLNMPGFDGADATRMLSSLCPSVKVVIVTASQSPTDAERALGAGAVRVIRKESPASTVVAAVLAAASGLTQAA
jgi:DNA-binding NarL/FixJ family response regulator